MRENIFLKFNTQYLKIFRFVLFSILILGLACSLKLPKKKKDEVIATKPNLNKIIVLYETTASYDTLNIEVNQKINLIIDKFVDTATGEIVENSQIIKSKIKWKSSALSILNCKKTDGYSNVITGVGKGIAKITITANLKSLDYPNDITTEINFRVFSPTINKISVTPKEITIRDSTQIGFSAKAVDFNGNEVKDERLVWYSSDETTASIDSTGRATGHLIGTDKQSCFIFASIENKNGIVYSDSSLLNVVRQEIYTARIAIEPEQAIILLESDLSYKAYAYMADAKKIENAYFEWRTSISQIAEVVSIKDGKECTATGKGVGDTIISASIYNTNSLKNIDANSILKVVDSTLIDRVDILPDTEKTVMVGETLDFSAKAYDSINTFINGVPFTWFSSDEKIATISPVTGTKGAKAILQAITNGKVDITATYGGKISNSTSVAIVFKETIKYDVALLSGIPGYPGLNEGDKNTAKFNFPFAIAASSDNIIYVADTYSNQIKKVDAYGKSTYVAGSREGKASYNEGTGDTPIPVAEALFNKPAGIAVDSQGNIYIADTGNFRIRKINKTDMKVYPIAGTGQSSYFNILEGNTKPGSQANFGDIYGLVIDNDINTLYVADATYHCIYEIDLIPPYNVVLYAGAINEGNRVGYKTNGATFGEPRGLTMDASGNIYVSDSRYNCIKKIDVNGDVTIIGGNSDTTAISGFQDGKQGKLFAPCGIVYDENDDILYIADTGNNAIRKLINLSTQGGETLLTIAGQGSETSGYTDDTTGDKALFRNPSGIAILGYRIIVADTNNHVLRSIEKK